MTTIHPEGWLPAKGYANGIVASGRMCFIAGQIGWNPRASPPTFPATFAGQFELALSNVLEVLEAAGGRPEQLCRLTVYVTDKKDYLASLKDVGAAWKKLLGRHYPAMALVQVVALVEDLAKVEIEATAMLDESARP
jgi:enamine deaminase RidA (YjgF/YER057c/UK114 family)